MIIAGGEGYIQIGDGEPIPCTFAPFEMHRAEPVVYEPLLPVLNSQAAAYFADRLGWVENRDYYLSPDLPMED